MNVPHTPAPSKARAAPHSPARAAGSAGARAHPHAPHRHGRRLVLSDRTIITHGLRRKIWLDLYHYMMTVDWPVLFAAFAGFFISFNLLFAVLYTLSPGCIANLNPAGFWGYFFFSVETLATVGYGDMHPQTVFGHIVASGEIFLGLMSIALMTGAIFARFSRPQARFLFASYGVVCPVEGKTTLMFRAANARQNIIMEAAAQLRVLRDAVTAEGWHIRRIVDLPLVRSQHPIFLLGWNLMHVIDEKSPLAGETPESLAKSRAIFLLNLSGTDETTGQVLMARQEYPNHLVRWNHRFRDILHPGADGLEHLDYDQFNLVDPIEGAPQAAQS
jgi:inward rectifier potassium channel